jgi:hypothetical protein
MERECPPWCEIDFGWSMESQTKTLKKAMWSGCGEQALNLSFAELYEIYKGGMSRCPLCTKKNRG